MADTRTDPRAFTRSAIRWAARLQSHILCATAVLVLTGALAGCAATIRMPDFPEILIVVAPQRHDGMQRTPGWFRKRPNSNIQQQPLELTGGDVDPPANDPPVADAGEATAPPPDDLAKPKRKRKGATP